MNAKQFAVAVVPIVVAEVVLNVVHRWVGGDNDNSWIDWALTGVSFVVFPFWAGVRVARVERRWLWWCVGGLCVLSGTVISIALLELGEPTLTDIPVPIIVGSLLVLVPVYALFGFLGGKVRSRGKSYGT